MEKRIFFFLLLLFSPFLIIAQETQPDCNNLPDRLTEEDPCKEGTVTECLTNTGLVTEGCPESQGPSIVNEFCQDGLGIARYLRRAAQANMITNLNRKSVCKGYSTPPPPADAVVNCDPTYTACSSTYCPDNYCAQIQALVDMDIQFISRAASAWFNESSFLPGSATWAAQSQFICDINAAYDCAGQARPIIQAGVFEGIGTSPGAELSKPQLDKILCALGLDYTDLPAVHFPDGAAKNADNLILPFEFSKDDMHNPSGYEISEIETQIWFMFQAMSFIDMGYTALHMGDFQSYTKTDPDLLNLTDVLSSIRAYADEQGSLLVMNGEGGNAKEFGTDNFLFDFSSIPASFQEEDTEHNTTIGDYCDVPPNTEIFSDPTPCNNPDDQAIAAYITECVLGTHFSENELIGTSPSGCENVEMPFYIYIDHGHGAAIDEDCNLDPEVMGLPSSHNGPVGDSHFGPSTYGYDDSRWFGHEISPECRSYLFQSYYCQIRELYPNASLLVPLQLRLKFPEYAIDKCTEVGDPNTSSSGYYAISDEPDFVNDMVNLMEPVEPTIDITSRCITTPICVPQCNGNFAPLGYQYYSGYYEHEVNVTNEDCSSIYSIHVFDDKGQWIVDYAEGTTMNFSVPESGYYTIKIRQDNLGFSREVDTNQNGVLTSEFEVYLEKNCCELIPAGLCPTRKMHSGGGSNPQTQDFEMALGQPNPSATIYPNPISNTDDLFLIYPTEAGQSYQLSLWSINGAKVQDWDLQGTGGTEVRIQLDRTLANGLYMISLRDDQGQILFSEKVSVQ